jgi:PPM family protein phosphatase
VSLSLHYAARSDVGLVREGNEDSGYAGPRLLAVADGMGGHAAGEVASAIVIATLAALDEDVPGSGLLDALEEAVQRANSQVREIVAGDPALQGMGTTLTALLSSGARLGLAHVGDSRAYRLRDGEFEQITHDHTFVQTLVDEGRITPQEADYHPQRAMILRAVDGRDDLEIDLSVREARLGDRYLICSDGLSGVMSAETMGEALAGAAGPDEAADALVELALRAGAPDNVTCIVADLVERGATPSTSAVFVGAVDDSPAPQRRRGSAAERAAGLAQADREQSAGATREPSPPNARGRRWLRAVIVTVAVLGLLVAGGWGAYAWSQQQYYVGPQGAQAAIFRGLSQHIAGLSLSQVYEPTDATLADLPRFQRERVQEKIDARDLDDARAIASRLAAQASACRSALAEERSSAKAKPTPARTATRRPSIQQPSTRQPSTQQPSTPRTSTKRAATSRPATRKPSTSRPARSSSPTPTTSTTTVDTSGCRTSQAASGPTTPNPTASPTATGTS